MEFRSSMILFSPFAKEGRGTYIGSPDKQLFKEVDDVINSSAASPKKIN